jgi:hypothetical protein
VPMHIYGSSDAGRGLPVDPSAADDETVRQLQPDVSPRRVLVLGSVGHPRSVDSFPWHELPDDLHVGDYEVLILDLTPLADEDQRQQLDHQRLPSWEQWSRAIFGGACVIAIGAPALSFAPDVDAYYWLPYRPEWTAERGREVAPMTDEELAGYFSAVKRWNYHWEQRASWHNCDESRFLRAVHPALQSCRIEVESLVTTLFGKPLAVRISYAATVGGGTQGQTFAGDIPTRSGPVYLLPPATEWSSHEAVRYWLQLLGVEAEHAAPQWAARFVLPDEDPLATRAADLRAALAETQRALDEVIEKQEQAGRWRQLLYETGDALEVVVRDALTELGASVTAPSAAGREDGRLVVPDGDALLEIKGTRGPIKLEHVRQLRQWTDDALAREALDAKGLLVANAFSAIPPPERGPAVSGDTLRLAERWHQCLLTTPQLFGALVEQQAGRLDRDWFWATIFSTNGLADVADLGSGSG